MFAVSVTVIVLEISITRISSALFSYHFAFFAIATTFAGLGMGGVLGGHLLKGISKADLVTPLAKSCLIFVVMAVISFLVVTMLPTPNFAVNTILLFGAFIPAGVFLSTSYRYLSSLGNIVYAADVLGAAIGSLLIVTLFEKVDPLGSVLIISVFLASILIVASVSSKSIRLVVANVSVVVALALLILTPSILSLRVDVNLDQGKELSKFLRDPHLDASITDSRWSSFGRTDLVELRGKPDEMDVFIDGGAGTSMYQFSGDISNVTESVEALRTKTAAFPYYFANKSEVLIIGPGAGVDVLTGLLFNVTRLHAIEINRDIVDIVRDYSKYNGGIYTQFENVEVHVDEGRNYLKRTNQTYDVIMLNIPVTKTLQGTFENAMAENYLFTVESLRDYLAHLRENGVLVVVTHDPIEVYKLVATSIQADGGASNAKQVLSKMVATQSPDHPPFPVLMIRNTPFTADESETMLRKSDELGFAPMYFPSLNETARTRLDKNMLVLEEETGFTELIAAGVHQGLDFIPATDDRPFFYKFEEGLPITLSQLLTFSIVLAFSIFVLYFVMREKSNMPKHGKGQYYPKPSLFITTYFALLGVGFMLFETPFIQKFILFLGPPTIAITAVLFGLLIWMAFGGILSKRYASSKDIAFKATLLIGTLMIIYAIALPVLFDTLLGLDLTYRLVATFVLLGPAGLVLGVPFSAGIAIMDREYPGRDIAWMWGINGLFSLVGSSLAASLAMIAGFNPTILLGAAVYLTISYLGFSRMRRGEKL